MNKILIGKIVNTHGIKGELRIISDFIYKDKVFIVGNKLIIDDKEYIINSYRKHKNFDMVTLNDYKDINEVEFLIRKLVYISEDMINLDSDEILDEEICEYSVIEGSKSGSILEVFNSSETNRVLRVLIKEKEVLIPYNKEFIKSINKEDKTICIELIGGMLDED